MINYTFVIPHKDIPELLARCVASIPKREDVEVIVVDDGSGQSVRNSDVFKRISANGVQIILTDERLGAGNARNVGLEAAEGEWVIFADADDYFEPAMLDALDQFIDSPLDVVFFKTQCIESDNPQRYGSRQRMCEKWNGLIDDIINGDDEATANLLVDCVVPWGKMVRRQFLIDYAIKFETVPFSNDVVWTALILANIDRKRLGCSDKLIYSLTERTESLSKNETAEAFLCRCGVFQRRYHILKESGYANYEAPVNYPVNFEKAKSYGPGTLIKYFRLVKSMETDIPPEYEIEKKLHFRYPYLYFTVLLLQSFKKKRIRK